MIRPAGPVRKYPWKRWLERKTSVTLKSEDYSASQKSMCVMIRQQARLHGRMVSVYPKEDGTIRIVPRGKRVL